jgi:Ca2+-binding RTX toxin-like protein
MLSIFKRIFRSGRSTSRQRETALRRRQFEALEKREMMAASILASFNPSERVLSIEGTPGNDTILVQNHSDRISISGSAIQTISGGVVTYADSISAASISRIEIKSLDGNDSIRMQESGTLTKPAIPMYIWGGLGNDFIKGGSAADRLFGEGGNDYVYGEAGNDLVYGGDGVDVLDGGLGKDYVNATGSDGPQHDRLLWSPGDDDFQGKAYDPYWSNDHLVYKAQAGDVVEIYARAFVVNGHVKSIGSVSDIQRIEIETPEGKAESVTVVRGDKDAFLSRFGYSTKPIFKNDQVSNPAPYLNEAKGQDTNGSQVGFILRSDGVLMRNNSYGNTSKSATNVESIIQTRNGQGKNGILLHRDGQLQMTYDGLTFETIDLGGQLLAIAEGRDSTGQIFFALRQDGVLFKIDGPHGTSVLGYGVTKLIQSKTGTGIPVVIVLRNNHVEQISDGMIFSAIDIGAPLQALAEGRDSTGQIFYLLRQDGVLFKIDGPNGTSTVSRDVTSLKAIKNGLGVPTILYETPEAVTYIADSAEKIEVYSQALVSQGKVVVAKPNAITVRIQRITTGASGAPAVASRGENLNRIRDYGFYQGIIYDKEVVVADTLFTVNNSLGLTVSTTDTTIFDNISATSSFRGNGEHGEQWWEHGTSSPEMIQYADLNGDGLTDALYFDTNRSGSIWVGINDGKNFRGAGSGQWWEHGASTPDMIQYADVNGDGLTDALYFDTNRSGGIWVGINDGKSFRGAGTGQWWEHGASTPDMIQYADVNGDGLTDALYFDTNRSGGIWVGINDGKSFRGAGTGQWWEHGASTPDMIQFADVNGDGLTDALYFDTKRSGGIWVGINDGKSFRGAGTGQWWEHGASTPDMIQYADVNGDGLTDALYFDTNRSGGIWVGINDGKSFRGNGQRGAQWWEHGASTPDMIQFADVSGDGLADALYFDTNRSGGIWVGINDGKSFRGNGQRGEQWWEHGPSTPDMIQFDDVNGDNIADAIYADTSRSGGIGVGLASSKLSHRPEGKLAWHNDQYIQGSLQTLDLNLDGLSDIVYLEPSNNRLTVGINDKQGGFTGPGSGQWWNKELTQNQKVEYADVNGDALLDVILIDPEHGVVFVGINDKSSFNGIGSGQWDMPTFSRLEPRISLENEPPIDYRAMFRVADVNRDEKADLLIFDAGRTNQLYVGINDGKSFRGAGTGQWWEHGASTPDMIQYADVNGDGLTDALYYDTNRSGGIWVGINDGSSFRGAGTGQWWEHGASSPDMIQYADVNGDGLTDALYFDTSRSGGIWVGINDGKSFRGAGTGQWWEHGASSPEMIQYADVNGDGRKDAIYTDISRSRGVWVGINNGQSFRGNGSHGEQSWLSEASSPSALQFADLNGDRRADALYVSLSNGTDVYAGYAGFGSTQQLGQRIAAREFVATINDGTFTYAQDNHGQLWRIADKDHQLADLSVWQTGLIFDGIVGGEDSQITQANLRVRYAEVNANPELIAQNVQRIAGNPQTGLVWLDRRNQLFTLDRNKSLGQSKLVATQVKDLVIMDSYGIFILQADGRLWQAEKSNLSLLHLVEARAVGVQKNTENELVLLKSNGELCIYAVESQQLTALPGGIVTYDTGADGKLTIRNVAAVNALPLQPSLMVEDGSILVVGTDADETISVTLGSNVVTVSINSYTTSLNLPANFNNQIKIYGRGGDDTIHGSSVRDFIFGGLGNDTVFGNDGNDQIFGESGSDTLYGGYGDDLLNAGSDGWDNLDIDYWLAKGNDTYIVEGSGTIRHDYEFRRVFRNNETVNVREDNSGHDQLFFNNGQRDDMDDEGFWDNVGVFLEESANSLAAGQLFLSSISFFGPFGVFASKSVGTEIWGEQYEHYATSGLAMIAGIAASIGTAGAASEVMPGIFAGILSNAAKSAASQVVMLIGGEQKMFDWSLFIPKFSIESLATDIVKQLIFPQIEDVIFKELHNVVSEIAQFIEGANLIPENQLAGLFQNINRIIDWYMHDQNHAPDLIRKWLTPWYKIYFDDAIPAWGPGVCPYPSPHSIA